MQRSRHSLVVGGEVEQALLGELERVDHELLRQRLGAGGVPGVVEVLLAEVQLHQLGLQRQHLIEVVEAGLEAPALAQRCAVDVTRRGGARSPSMKYSCGRDVAVKLHPDQLVGRAAARAPCPGPSSDHARLITVPAAKVAGRHQALAQDQAVLELHRAELLLVSAEGELQVADVAYDALDPGRSTLAA